jgi:hypothetical protein
VYSVLGNEEKNFDFCSFTFHSLMLLFRSSASAIDDQRASQSAATIQLEHKNSIIGTQELNRAKLLSAAAGGAAQPPIQ